MTQVQFSPRRAHIARICAAQESRSPAREKYIAAGTRAGPHHNLTTQRDRYQVLIHRRRHEDTSVWHPASWLGGCAGVLVTGTDGVPSMIRTYLIAA